MKYGVLEQESDLALENRRIADTIFWTCSKTTVRALEQNAGLANIFE
jgi:hypothetical protein